MNLMNLMDLMDLMNLMILMNFRIEENYTSCYVQLFSSYMISWYVHKNDNDSESEIANLRTKECVGERAMQTPDRKCELQNLI